MIATKTPAQAMYSLEVRKRFGKPNSFGGSVFGWTVFGDSEERAGIYQIHHWAGRTKTVKMKFYWPPYYQYGEQEVYRARFADAVAAWKVLSDEEKETYNWGASGQPLSGYNLFIREYMLNF
jgi:hypothetical protein